MALSLCGADGCGVVVHDGFLRTCPVSCVHTIYQPTNCLCVAQIIMFSDLECDYINPIDLCNKLNQVRVLQALVRLCLHVF